MTTTFLADLLPSRLGPKHFATTTNEMLIAWWLAQGNTGFPTGAALYDFLGGPETTLADRMNRYFGALTAATVFDNFGSDRATLNAGLATSGQTWTSPASWATAGGQLAFGTGVGGVASIPHGSADHDVYAHFSASGSNPGVIVRHTDNSNYVMWMANGSVRQVVAGVATDTAIGGGGTRLRAVALGGNIDLYSNGALRGSLADATTGTNIGIGLSNSGGGGISCLQIGAW